MLGQRRSGPHVATSRRAGAARTGNEPHERRRWPGPRRRLGRARHRDEVAGLVGLGDAVGRLGVVHAQPGGATRSPSHRLRCSRSDDGSPNTIAARRPLPTGKASTYRMAIVHRFGGCLAGSLGDIL